MVGHTCQRCNRTIPADSIRPEAVFCPFCGWQENRQTGTDQSTVTPASQPEPPVEEVFFTLRESIPRYMGSVIMMNTLLSAALGSITFLIFLSGALAGHAPLIRVLVCTAMMFGFFWAFCSLATVPVMLFSSLFCRSRRFGLKGTVLHVRIGRDQRTHDLAGHLWQRCGKLPMDTYGYYFRTRPRLKVVVDRYEYGLGFTEEAAAEWIKCFQAAGLKEKPPAQWRPILARCVLASFAGGAVGAIAEPLLPLPKNQPGAIIFTGFLNGLAIGMICWIPGSRERVARKRWGFVACMAVFFAGNALLVVGIFAWQVYTLSSLVGAVLGWFLWRAPEPARSPGS